MKTTKIDFQIKIASIFLWIALSGSFYSCDVLEPDADMLEPQVTLEADRIYVLSDGLAFIDLNTKVKTNTPVRLSVTSSTRYGELSDLGKGLLQYSPSAGNKKALDAFEFTVFSEKNEVIKIDTITIVVENDSTHLPCGIFPSNDYIYSVKKNVSYQVNVLANDNICGYDSANLVVSIYRPDNTFPPHQGIAEISGQNIVYTPGNSFEEQDELIYKVYPSGQPDKAAYGIAYFTGERSCRFSLKDDVFLFEKDSISGTVYLPALANDSLCYALNNYQINVSQAPYHGNAQVNGNGFTYEVSDTAVVSSFFSDFFLYEVCIDANCRTARVDILVKQDSVYACGFEAVVDSVDISGNDIPVLYFDVLYNDLACNGISTFTLTQEPLYGSAFTTVISGNKVIGYERNSLITKNDLLEYEICNTEKCSRAKVFIKLEK